MRVAIVGSRQYKNVAKISAYIQDLPNDTTIISGGAMGVDTLAETCARGLGLKTEIYKPDYSKYPGRTAPLERNQMIAERCDFMVAFWNGTSTGTQHAMNCAKKLGKKVVVIR